MNGSDANNGLGPDASHASNKPWKTITKLLGAAGMASGDTAYLSPAGPFRETISVAMTSAVAETKILGDPQNAQGFKTSGGVAVAPGPIIVTAYTTNDKTAPSATVIMNLQGRDFLTFQYITWVGGSANNQWTATTTTSTNITIKDCCFITGSQGTTGWFNATCAFNTPFHWLIDRCTFLIGSASLGTFTLTAGTGADYDADVLIQNSVFVGSRAAPLIQVSNSGASANKGGGVRVRNCSHFSGQLMATGAGTSTTVPCVVDNCFIWSPGVAALNANTSGQITEDYNIFVTATARTNVTSGTHSIADGSYAPLIHIGQERTWGSPLFKPFAQPMQGSPLLGFGNDGSQSATDGINLQRPAGGGSASPATGAMERHNNWITDPSPIGNGQTPIKITGPGDQAFLIPVKAQSTTISVVVKWDATYAGTKPQLQMDANGLNGVATQTVTATGGSGSNETLTLAAFTPSRAGFMVTVRVKSNDTNGAGVVQADSFSVV